MTTQPPTSTPDPPGPRAAVDARALELALEANAGRLLATARRLLGDAHEAQDAVQDGIVAALRGLPSFEGRAQLSTWLHRVVVNHALLRLRRRDRRPEGSIEDLLPRFTEAGFHDQRPARWRENPVEALDRAEMREQVWSCIRRLPDSYRVPLVLRDIEGMDMAAIAEAMELTTNAVKTRVHRARQMLKACLDPLLQEESP